MPASSTSCHGEQGTCDSAGLADAVLSSAMLQKKATSNKVENDLLLQSSLPELGASIRPHASSEKFSSWLSMMQGTRRVNTESCIPKPLKEVRSKEFHELQKSAALARKAVTAHHAEALKHRRAMAAHRKALAAHHAKANATKANATKAKKHNSTHHAAATSQKKSGADSHRQEQQQVFGEFCKAQLYQDSFVCEDGSLVMANGCCGSTEKCPSSCLGQGSGISQDGQPYCTCSQCNLAMKLVLTEEERYTKAHNYFRCRHGQPALSWDATVANNAKGWVATCPGQAGNPAHDYPEGTMIGNPTDSYKLTPSSGENIQGGLSSPEGATEHWYSEVTAWDGGTAFLPETGHYTALIWGATTKLGCAQNACLSSVPNPVHVCQYAGEAPNIGGSESWAANVPSSVIPTATEEYCCQEIYGPVLIAAEPANIVTSDAGQLSAEAAAAEKAAAEAAVAEAAAAEKAAAEAAAAEAAAAEKAAAEKAAAEKAAAEKAAAEKAAAEKAAAEKAAAEKAAAEKAAAEKAAAEKAASSLKKQKRKHLKAAASSPAEKTDSKEDEEDAAFAAAAAKEGGGSGKQEEGSNSDEEVEEPKSPPNESPTNNFPTDDVPTTQPPAAAPVDAPTVWAVWPHVSDPSQVVPGETPNSLQAPVYSGEKQLNTVSNDGFVAGMDIVIDAGTAVEETNRIVSFGSLILQDPLKYDHGANILINQVRPTINGATAELDKDGFLAVTSLCCPVEMEIFFLRLLDDLGYMECSHPHIQGLMHWFHCVPAMDFQYMLDVIRDGNPCKFWADKDTTCPQLSPECEGKWCR